MAEVKRIPFVVGQKAEAMCFQPGYRGAWFRCEIAEINRRKGDLGAVLSYYDYQDEKQTWLKLYQIPRKSKERRRQLMLRPQYPAIFDKSQSPDVNTVSEVIVIVDGVWKVGDLVDWWCTDCYWSGQLTEILDDDKARIQLPPPPLGEGLSYEVSIKELRPSLEWSLELGWTVPVSKDGNESRYCARLIQPAKQAAGNLPSLHIQSGSVMRKRPLSATHSKKVKEAPESTTQFVVSTKDIGETSSHRIPASRIGEASAEITAKEDMYDSSCSLKKFKSSEGIPLNSTHSDTLVSTIMNLEELANKVKWLRSTLQSGTPVSNAVRPLWKFIEHRGSSLPK